MGTHLQVTHVYAMPHVDTAPPELERVDCHFLIIGVDKVKAEEYRAEFIELLDSYPYPDRLAGGPSYIEVGAQIGDQGAALQLFALGKVLGLWDVMTPERLGIVGAHADDLAGRGFIMMTGYHGGKA